MSVTITSKSALSILRLASVARGDGFDFVAVAAQGYVEQFADRALVVADENVTHAHLLLLLRLQRACRRLRARPRRFLVARRVANHCSCSMRRRRTTKLVPLPTSERAHTLPSCACTIW
jgi:hypothetical protein